jgi:hypothetical protein
MDVRVSINDPFLLAGAHAPAEVFCGRCWKAGRRWTESGCREHPIKRRYLDKPAVLTLIPTIRGAVARMKWSPLAVGGGAVK